MNTYYILYYMMIPTINNYIKAHNIKTFKLRCLS